MLVTLDTSQRPMGWLNADAPSNVLFMYFTFDTSHPEMSPLNPDLPWNAPARLVS